MGDAGNERSDALKPLWKNFSGFFDSIQNVAIQFRRMEADADINVGLAGKLEQANQTICGLQAKVDSLDLKKLVNQLPAVSDTNLRNEVITLLPLLSQKNPPLVTSLKMLLTLYPDRLIVLKSALDSAQTSSAFRQGEKAFDLLCKLATSYWEAIQQNGDVEARKLFGNAYSPMESSKLSKAGIDRRTFVRDGTFIFMEKHLKIGVADNAADTLRIHFEWLADEKRIVVGHCGRHLDF